MPRRVHRPKAPKKRIQTRNDFELCYLRHTYFRRVKYNPTQVDMKPFMQIAHYLAKNTFFFYKNLFHIVGLESEDVINIANVHLVSFLGLYSLENMPEKHEEFVKVFKGLHGENPNKADILDKNKANFTMFLKQRMDNLVRICRQKARNIKGLQTEESYFYYSKNEPPTNHRDLIKNYEKLGFRKLDMAVYKSIRKHAGSVYGSTFQLGDYYYVAVPLEQKTLGLDDFSGAGMDPHDSVHNMTPEEMYDSKMWEKRRHEFHGKPIRTKTHIIRRFIKTHEQNEEFKEEVRTARKILRELNQC